MSRNSITHDSLSFETLRTLLESAVGLVGDIASDQLFMRLLRTFTRAPAEDRDALVRLFEREVGQKLLADATRDTLAGLRLRLNPRAQLYTRLVRSVQQDNPEAVFAAIRAMRLFHLAVGPDPRVWTDKLHQALGVLESEERQNIAAFSRLLLEQIERCEAEKPLPLSRTA
jgi:hypothetical protein